MTTTAKQLFGQGEYRTAEQAFLAVASSAQTSVHRSLQLSNASQCALNLSQYERAAQHAQQAITWDAQNTKAHYRLAAAYAAMPLPQPPIDAARRCCDIAMANARAFALMSAATTRKSLPNVVGLELVSCHQHPISVRAADLLRHVSHADVVLVTSAQQIVSCRGAVAVLVPGCQLQLQDFSMPAHIVGLDGSAVLNAFSECHALYLQQGRLSAWCLRFKGASDAMTCTTADLALVDCSISDHAEHAVLVAGPTAMALLAFCTLSNCISGIEVRQGASATVVRSTIRNMARKGISAYGGARSVLLEETLVEDVAIEGVQCLGPRAPAVFNSFGLNALQRRLREISSASAVADAVMAAAREDVNSARLVVTLRNCCVQRCGTDRTHMIRSGVTIDQGASAVIQGCLFTGCGMASVFIKGGCDVSVQYCRVDHGHSGDAGVRVDVNHEGIVNVEHSVFVGKPARAIVETVTSTQTRERAMMRAMTGARSAPINKHMTKTVARARNAPTIDSLREELKQEGIGSQQAASVDRIPLTNVHIPGGAGLLNRQLGKQNSATEYPIGNTYGNDVLRYADTKNLEKGEASVVLAACGDIRNVVETICALEKKQYKKVSFLLNDISISILARNIALLELACRLWPKTAATEQARKRAARIWLHAWGSIALTSGDHSALHRVLADLTKGKLPVWLSPPGVDVQAALTTCWSEWASCKRTLKDVRDERDGLTSFNTDRKNVRKATALAAGLKETESSALLDNAELLNREGEKVNPTLLASGLYYNMYESSIFRAIDMRAFIQGDVTKLHAAACGVMNEKGPIVSRALHSGAVRIEVQPGDLTFVLGSQRDVDAVELSNALDYISKPACLISAARCLSRPGGVILLHTMMARNLEQSEQSVRDDLREHFLRGANSEELIAVLGLRAVEVGNDTTGSYGDGIHSHARWVYQAKSCKWLETADCKRLRASMMDAAKMWCYGPNPAGQNCTIGFHIAAWPSAIAALQMVAAATSSTDFQPSEVVREMCNASPAIAPFELELNAHATIMDGKDKELILATLVLHGLENDPVIGMHVHLLLQLGLNLGEDNEKTVWLFDVFECSIARGVCEVIVRKDDVSRMRSLSVRLCKVQLHNGVLNGVTQSTSLTLGRVLKTRELSDSETVTLRKALCSSMEA